MNHEDECRLGKAMLVEPDPGDDSFTHRAINLSKTRARSGSSGCTPSGAEIGFMRDIDPSSAALERLPVCIVKPLALLGRLFNVHFMPCLRAPLGFVSSSGP